ncbi:Mitogen-activated protein kinase, partial [Ceratobasidium sp. 394]
ALAHPYLAVWHDPNDEPVCSSTFDFGFEDEDSVEGMRNLIVEEVNTFRAAVRSQARAAAGAKRQDTLPVPSREEVINSPIRDTVPANGSTSNYTSTGRAPSPVMDDPSEELARELEQRLGH